MLAEEEEGDGTGDGVVDASTEEDGAVFIEVDDGVALPPLLTEEEEGDGTGDGVASPESEGAVFIEVDDGVALPQEKMGKKQIDQSDQYPQQYPIRKMGLTIQLFCTNGIHLGAIDRHCTHLYCKRICCHLSLHKRQWCLGRH